MPTELEELVEFLHHGRTDIRQIAVQNLKGFSKADQSLFKYNKFEPIKDLKLLVKDYTAIAKDVLTMLINLSEDQEILKLLVEDNDFIESLLFKLTNQKEENADDIAMLLANMAKSKEMIKILDLKRRVPQPLSTSEYAIDQIMDCFVKGADKAYNKNANYDYLSYFFADLSQFEECRNYFTTPQSRDSDIIPLTKLTVFTETKSDIRRRGVASTIKNVAFEVGAHPHFIAADSINIFPYLLLPIMGSEEYSLEDTEGMLDDVQLLPPDKERERDPEILKTHLDTLLLLTTSRQGRDHMRTIRVYPIVRELHAHVENEGVQEACDRVVQVIMRDEEGEESTMPKVVELPDEDEDDQIVDVL